MRLLVRRSMVLLALGLFPGCLAFHRGAMPGEPKDAQFAEVEGARIRYVDVGQGPAVVLIHGYASSLETWAALIPQLAKTHRVLALDLKGFGWSDRPEGDYSPRNYDGRFHGATSMRVALANSYNIPAVWLMDQVGIANVIKTARRVGVSSLNRELNTYGLSLTLGGGQVLQPAAKKIRRRHLEMLERIERLWSGEPVNYDGKHFKLQATRISMRPLQSPRPPVWLAANSDGGVRRAARCVHQLVACEHVVHDLRWVLKIGIHHDDRIAAGQVQPGGQHVFAVEVFGHGAKQRRRHHAFASHTPRCRDEHRRTGRSDRLPPARTW